MKYQYVIKLLIINFLYLSGSAALNAQLRPTTSKAVVRFIFKNPKDHVFISGLSFNVESQNEKKTYRLETDSIGVVELLLPIDDHYTIHLSNWDDFATIHIPKGAYQKHEFPVPYYQYSEDKPLDLSIPVIIKLLCKNGKAWDLQEKIRIRALDSTSSTIVHTNNKGEATLSLALGKSYRLSLQGAPDYYQFEMPHQPFATWTETLYFERREGYEKYPSIEQALINFVFQDLKGRPVEGELFWVEAQKNHLRYRAKTNAAGLAQILVPINDSYTLNTPNNLNFGQQALFLEEGADLLVETIEYLSISTTEWKARRTEQTRLAAKRDALIQERADRVAKQLDSLKNAKLEQQTIERILKNNVAIPILRTFRVRKAIRAKVAYFKEQITIHPKVYEAHSKPILSSLERLKNNWKGTLIVTDITQSMQPYLEEVLLWHALNLRDGDRYQYIFFNDGDRKMASAKKIGKTGGIYTCTANYASLDSIIATMHQAIENGLGGAEPPENDLEAVLVGIQLNKQVKEIILIADSYSRVRDLELLGQIPIPLRIILCGAEEQNNFYRGLAAVVNEEYLTIARRTNGSVHTLKEDILGLNQVKEGEIIEVSGHRFLLRNNQFIKLN